MPQACSSGLCQQTAPLFLGPLQSTVLRGSSARAAPSQGQPGLRGLSWVSGRHSGMLLNSRLSQRKETTPSAWFQGPLGGNWRGPGPVQQRTGPSNTHRITRQVSIHRKWWVLTGSPLWEALGGDETCEGLQSGRDSTHSCLSF